MERRHRHIVEIGLILLHQASVPLSYWSVVFSTAVYLINRLPTPILQHQYPFFKLFFTNPNYLKFKIFGSLCYPWLKPYTTHKLDPIMPIIVLILTPKKNFTSRHIVFVENEFSFSKIHSHELRVIENGYSKRL